MFKLVDWSGISGAPSAAIALTEDEARCLLCGVATVRRRGDWIQPGLYRKVVALFQSFFEGDTR